MKKILKKSSALLTFMVVLFLQAAPTTLAATIIVNTLDTGGLYAPYGKIDVATDYTNNDMHMVTTAYPSSYSPSDATDGVGIVYFSNLDNAGWSGKTELLAPTPSTSHTITRPKIAVAPDGQVGVVWFDEDQGLINYILKSSGGSWGNIGTIDPSNTYTYPTIGFVDDEGTYEPFIVTNKSLGLHLYTWGDLGSFEESIISQTTDNENQVTDIDVEVTNGDIIHVFTGPNPNAGPSAPEGEKSVVHYYKGTPSLTTPPYSWDPREDVITGITNFYGHSYVSSSVDKNTGDLRVITVDSPEEDGFNSQRIYFAQQISGVWQTPVHPYMQVSSLGNQPAPKLETYYDGVDTWDYIAITTGDRDNLMITSATDGFAGMLTQANIYAASDIGTENYLAHIEVTGDLGNNYGTANSNNQYTTGISLGVNPVTENPDIVAIFGVVGGGDEGGGNMSCSDLTAGDGNSYTTSLHSYATTSHTYENTPEVSGTNIPYASWITSGVNTSAEFILTDSTNQNVNCVIGVTPSSWDLVLAEVDADGDTNADAYISAYFASGDFGSFNSEAAIQPVLDQMATGFGISSVTLDYYLNNAFTYSSGYSFDDVGTPGEYITLKNASDNIVSNEVTVDSNKDAPEIIMAGGTGGESVPEFKDYLLIVTIALALGLAYTVLPKTGATKA